MLKINKKVEYALMVLKYISNNQEKQELFSARDISSNLNIPFDTTSKVLQILTKNELVKSTQGISGGYILNCDLRKVNYFYINKLIDEKITKTQCETKNCNLEASCNIKSPVSKLNSFMNDYFKQISLWDLFFDSEYKLIDMIDHKVQAK
ncbi:MAG: Rrf2 family transcriptional regulator [Bacteriovoracaceae bacterium]|nr:Rrf2 family transcriptional regulator [Bacteriovoracaceae bacterium]